MIKVDLQTKIKQFYIPTYYPYKAITIFYIKNLRTNKSVSKIGIVYILNIVIGIRYLPFCILMIFLNLQQSNTILLNFTQFYIKKRTVLN
jgi:hypothetical protein